MKTFEERQQKQATNDGQSYTLQRKSVPEHVGGFVDNRPKPVIQRMENNTGLPDSLKQGVENLYGMDISDVRVHRNSSKPASLNALAYTQGTNIHVAPGQERHLPHEAWHVVQQKQGRVKPTFQTKGKVNINDDARLEREADAAQSKVIAHIQSMSKPVPSAPLNPISAVSPQNQSLQFYSYPVSASNAIADSNQNVVQCINHSEPHSGIAEEYDANYVEYEDGHFATVGAIVLTTRNNNNARSQPTSPSGADKINNGNWNAEDFEAGASHAGTTYSNADSTTVSILGGVTATSSNQLTKIHIIHHRLGEGTNNNSENIFWGNPGFNNPDILKEEDLMLTFLGQGGQANIFAGTTTLEHDFYGTTGDNSVVEHNGHWYAKTNAKLIAQSGTSITSGPNYNVINAAFGNPTSPVSYQQVDTTKVPHVGSYSMDVKYGDNGMSYAAMLTALQNAVSAEYTNRTIPKWSGEDGTKVNAELASIAQEANMSISREVLINQGHYELNWKTPSGNPAPANYTIPIEDATTWNPVRFLSNTVQDTRKPRFVVEMEYKDTAGNPASSGKKYYDWI